MKSGTITIHRVTKKDDEAVKAMIVGILEEEFPAEERVYLSEGIENVSENYSHRGEAFFAAFASGKIVGTVGIKQEDERNALLRRIFVKPDYRGKRIGSRLIQKAIQFCKGQGYEEIIFKTTSRMQDAIRLCESNGFAKRATIELGALNLFKFTCHLDKVENHRVRTGEKAKGRRS